MTLTVVHVFGAMNCRGMEASIMNFFREIRRIRQMLPLGEMKAYERSLMGTRRAADNS